MLKYLDSALTLVANKVQTGHHQIGGGGGGDGRIEEEEEEEEGTIYGPLSARQGVRDLHHQPRTTRRRAGDVFFPPTVPPLPGRQMHWIRHWWRRQAPEGSWEGIAMNPSNPYYTFQILIYPITCITSAPKGRMPRRTWLCFSMIGLTKDFPVWIWRGSSFLWVLRVDTRST